MKSLFEQSIISFSGVYAEKGVALYGLRNGNLEMLVSNLGARVVGLWAPGRDGKRANVCLGYRSAEAYMSDEVYLGAAVGPLANRLANGQFTLNGKTYQMPVNAGKNCLHSGALGISKRIWKVRRVVEDSIEMSVEVFPENHQYPGRVVFHLRYTLTPENVLEMYCETVTDSPAPVNVTQHNYYNLKGEAGGDIADHWISMKADHIVEVGETFIPTGKLLPVENTPFDLRGGRVIAHALSEPHPQIALAGGFDHTFVFSPHRPWEEPLVTVVSESAGRKMELFTNQPGVQFYTANSLKTETPGFSGKCYGHRGGFCLEAQNFPDAINQPGFPDSVVTPDHPGAFYAAYKFSVI
ncbi:MAG: galactose-1-epimerase [Bacteroidetes bacterium]|nr:MAG: galactose-1-epimerase [Bacteroidota bacterium]PIE87775.1 MAG: galactose-1-epimerase [Bacteroidota bacterium]